MTTISFDIVGFDLDGTFLDTSGDISACVNFALGEAGRPLLTTAQITPMIGGGAKHLLTQAMEASGGCPPDELHRLYKLMLGYYEAHISVHTRPFPGAVAAVDALAAAGVKTAIVTNKFEGFARKLLTELDLIDRFVTIIGGDTMDKIMGAKGYSKPHRAPIDEMIRRCGGKIGETPTAFVGDSVYDIMAAKNAGVPSIACSFGFLMEPVEEMGADAIIDGYDELIPTLAALGH